jgi:hypothetical protein
VFDPGLLQYELSLFVLLILLICHFLFVQNVEEELVDAWRGDLSEIERACAREEGNEKWVEAGATLLHSRTYVFPAKRLLACFAIYIGNLMLSGPQHAFFNDASTHIDPKSRPQKPQHKVSFHRRLRVQMDLSRTYTSLKR